MNVQQALSRLWMTAALSAAMVAAGCQPTEPAPAQPAAQQPAQPQRSIYRPTAGPGMVVNSLAFPTGEIPSSAILLHTVTPAEVRAGQPYNYELHVTNLTSTTLQSVNVMATAAQNLDVTASQPEAQRTANGFNWNLGNLPANETRVIRVTGRADAVGNSSNCLSVSYNNLLCTAVRVTQPALAISKTAPAEVLQCDEIQMVVEVRNTGSGVASNVRVTDNLPSGIRTIDGQQSVTQALGDIPAGEARRITIRAKADRTGSFQNQATVAADGNLSAQSNTTTTVVRKPKLELACAAPERIFLGRDAVFTFTVRNTGDAASRDTMLNMPLPAGTTFVSATEGGVASAAGVAWNLGSLAPNATRSVAVTLRPSGIETIRATATAQGFCADAVTANCVTSVQGIPAILLEMVDTVDPVEVGMQTTYIITVTNQGTATGTGINVWLELPPELDFVSASGATAGRLDGRAVRFAPLPSLAAKAKAEWRVVVRANAPKDVRTRALVTSDQFSVPLEKLESTNLYR